MLIVWLLSIFPSFTDFRNQANMFTLTTSSALPLDPFLPPFHPTLAPGAAILVATSLGEMLCLGSL